MNLKRLKMLFAALLLTGAAMASTNTLAVADQKCAPGDTLEIPVALVNTDVFCGMQADFTVPAGFSFITDHLSGPILTFSNRIPANEDWGCSSLNDSTFRIIIYSASSKPFSGNDSTLFSFQLVAPTTTGDYAAKVSNQELCKTDATAILPADFSFTITVEKKRLIGDINHDGNVDTSDLTLLIQHILNGDWVGNKDLIEDCDLNGDGDVNVTDVSVLMQIIFEA